MSIAAPAVAKHVIIPCSSLQHQMDILQWISALMLMWQQTGKVSPGCLEPTRPDILSRVTTHTLCVGTHSL